MLQLKKVLVPVDFSPTSARAYAYAAGVCKATGAALIALHAIPPVHYVETIDLAELAREADGWRPPLQPLRFDRGPSNPGAGNVGEGD